MESVVVGNGGNTVFIGGVMREAIKEVAEKHNMSGTFVTRTYQPKLADEVASSFVRKICGFEGGIDMIVKLNNSRSKERAELKEMCLGEYMPAWDEPKQTWNKVDKKLVECANDIIKASGELLDASGDPQMQELSEQLRNSTKPSHKK